MKSFSPIRFYCFHYSLCFFTTITRTIYERTTSASNFIHFLLSANLIKCQITKLPNGCMNERICLELWNVSDSNTNRYFYTQQADVFHYKWCLNLWLSILCMYIYRDSQQRIVIKRNANSHFSKCALEQTILKQAHGH